ncbi:selenium cofactor biosynthesis protein YqeC [Citrobacter sp. Marseille-Q3906]|uniref:selenium cofactor biosynthesis protein YqeC n=1 Tax=Citrobacter sp. Marseille-Q3906 TaxID=2866574 RepID=UPI001CE41104|nr:selenium cofactor biosynthesis protein YqeC [Citrobacter sp. Marseille-Q3906]
MKSIIDPAMLFIDLGAKKHPAVISVVGAGGKTSLLFWLAQLFQSSGRRVLITTTTHMFLPDSCWPVIFCRDPVMLPHVSLTSPVSFCFNRWKAQSGKAQGFAPDVIDALAQRPECDVILVEADGSRGLPLKAPDEHEPCIPQSSCCVIAVMSGHLLGTIIDAENIHRWPQFADITGLTSGSTLQFSDLVSLVRHPLGAFKNVPSGCRRVWFINRFSQCENVIVQSELLKPLQQHDVEAIWLGDIQENPAIARRFVK